MRHLTTRVAAVVAAAALVFVGSGAAGTALEPAHASATTQIENRVGAAWGLNSTGQVGDASWINRSIPVNVYGLTGVSKIAAGRLHSLAVMNDGTLRTWGANGNGQLGHGVFVHAPAPGTVPGLTGVVAAAGGWAHSLAVTSDGSVWAWGDNQHGQLGDGTTTWRFTPVRVQGLTGAVAVAAGNGWSLALRSDGTVWAWGSNAHSILGTGFSGSHSALPIMVAGLTNVVAVAAGAQHGMVIAAAPAGGRDVYTWGQNAVGQLGGSGLCQGIVCSTPVPYRVPGLPSIAAVAAGHLTSVALGTDGSVWTWGSGGFGALGDAGGTAARFEPGIALAAGSGIIQIAAGGHHVVAGHLNGTAIAWGSNAYGELGNGTTSTSSGMVAVSNLLRVRHLAAGEHHTLAIYGQPLVIGPPRR